MGAGRTLVIRGLAVIAAAALLLAAAFYVMGARAGAPGPRDVGLQQLDLSRANNNNNNDDNGKRRRVFICHKTGQNRFVLLRLSRRGARRHLNNHPGDFRTTRQRGCPAPYGQNGDDDDDDDNGNGNGNGNGNNND
jgi:hypothetical protein